MELIQLPPGCTTLPISRSIPRFFKIPPHFDNILAAKVDLYSLSRDPELPRHRRHVLMLSKTAPEATLSEVRQPLSPSGAACLRCAVQSQFAPSLPCSSLCPVFLANASAAPLIIVLS